MAAPNVRFDAPEWVWERLFPAHEMRALARRMRTRYAVASKDLDVASTINATCRQAGVFTPVFDDRSRIPEYTVLIDRISFGDQQARYFNHVLERIQDNEVFISTYYFENRPDYLVPDRRGEKPLPLRALSGKIHAERLIIFGSADCLFDEVTGDLIRDANHLGAWQERTLITPVSPDHWGYREARVMETFTVLPGSVEGLSRLGKPMDNELAGLVTGMSPVRLPDLLNGFSRHLVDRNSLAESERDEVMRAVEAYLDPESLLWLKACAQYPVMDWKLTLQLGYALRDANGDRILTSSRLLHLSRLPWFRYSAMPRWLRLELRRRMSLEENVQIRSILSTIVFAPARHLDDPLDVSIHPDELDAAIRNASQVSQMSSKIARERAATVPKRNPMGNRHLVSFISGKHVDPWGKRLKHALGGKDASRSVLSPKTADAIRTLRPVIIIGLLLAATVAYFWERVPMTYESPRVIRTIEPVSETRPDPDP